MHMHSGILRSMGTRGCPAYAAQRYEVRAWGAHTVCIRVAVTCQLTLSAAHGVLYTMGGVGIGWDGACRARAHSHTHHVRQALAAVQRRGPAHLLHCVAVRGVRGKPGREVLHRLPAARQGRARMCVRLRVYVYVRMRVYVCVHLCVCMCVRMYVCICGVCVCAQKVTYAHKAHVRQVRP